MRLFIDGLLHPLVLLAVLLFLALLSVLLAKKKAAKGFLWIAGIWFFLIFVSPLPTCLARQLEKQYPNISLDSLRSLPNVHILVLGGGDVIAPGLTPLDQLSCQSLKRLSEGIRLYHLLPGSKLVSSGYSGSGRTSEAQMVAMAALDLGVRAADTLMLRQPWNTEAEAKAYAGRFGNRYPLILVTDAMHLPRAMLLFRKNGLNPVASPANHSVKIDPRCWTYNFYPSISKINVMDQVIHESIGILVARLKY